MPTSNSQEPDDLDHVVRSALDLDVDTDALVRQVRIRVFETPRASWMADRLNNLFARAPLRVVSLCLAAAFGVGIALPQPGQSVKADAWINLALGDAAIPMGDVMPSTTHSTESN